MTDDKLGIKVAPSLIEPVNALVISSGTGDGKAVIETPDGHPNIVIQVVTPLAAILFRFANSFLTMLVSLVSAGMTTNIIPASDFYHLVMKCAILSVAGAGLGFLKDLVTIFSKLEQKFPLLRA